MKEKSTRGKIPIYEVSLELVVTDNMIKSQKNKARSNRLGGQKPIEAAGLMLWCGYDFCIRLVSISIFPKYHSFVIENE